MSNVIIFLLGMVIGSGATIGVYRWKVIPEVKKEGVISYSKPLPVLTVERVPYDTILVTAQHSVELREIAEVRDLSIYEKDVKAHLIANLAEELRDYVDISVDDSPVTHTRHYRASARVLKKRW